MKIEIPIQLKGERFLKVNANKQPIEKAWTTTTNYTYDEIVKQDPLTYGVLCGQNNLIVLDCDSKDAQDKLTIYPELMDTFITQSAGKKLYHFYFYVENIPQNSIDPNRNNQPRSFNINSKAGTRLLDGQAGGKMVVGPNSTLPDGRRYEVVSGKEIKTIDYKFLMSIVKSIDEQGTFIESETKKESKNSGEQIDFDEVCVAIKQNVKPVDILVEHFNDEKYRTENPTMCPLGHSSEGGKCFSHTGDVWFCHHCHQTGNVLQLYQKLNSCTFPESKKALADRIGLKDDLKKYFNQLYKEMKTRGMASDLLAEEIKKIYQVHVTRSDNKSEMWVYKNGIYVPEGRTYIESFCQAMMGFKYNSNFVRIVVDKIKASTYINNSDFFKNEDLNFVPFENGILNLTTREIDDFNPKYKFFSKHPIVYDPIAPKPKEFLKFLGDILPNINDRLVIQELYGYLLYRDYKLRKAWMFTGRGGNGKSKLIEHMQEFLGIENCTQIALQDLERDKFLGGELFNKSANMAADISSKELDDTAFFKKITGHDTLMCDRKFKSPIKFNSYAKQIFACNEVPGSPDESDGFYERWIILDFPFLFTDRPDPTDTMQKLRDVNISDKISTSREMMGVLGWALDGYDRLMKNQSFTYNESTDEVRQIMKRKSNSFTAFVSDELEQDINPNNLPIQATSIEREYLTYCRKHKVLKIEYRPKTKFEKLTNIGGYKTKTSINGHSVYVWRGIKWKNVKEEEFVLEDEDGYEE